MAEKYSLKLKYSLKYSLKLIYLMSDIFYFFYSLFHIQYSKAGTCYLFGINNNQTFRISNFDSSQSLGRKVQSFNPLGFGPKSTFSHKTCKVKSHSELLNEKSLIYCRETALIFDLMQRLLNRTLVLKS